MLQTLSLSLSWPLLLWPSEPCSTPPKSIQSTRIVPTGQAPSPYPLWVGWGKWWPMRCHTSIMSKPPRPLTIPPTPTPTLSSSVCSSHLLQDLIIHVAYWSPLHPSPSTRAFTLHYLSRHPFTHIAMPLEQISPEKMEYFFTLFVLCFFGTKTLRQCDKKPKKRQQPVHGGLRGITVTQG